MPRVTKPTPLLQTRLSREDYSRFEKLVQASGKTKTEFVRDALRAYIDQLESGVVQDKADAFDKSMKRFENRLASLLVRIGTDVATLRACLWARTPQEERKEFWDACYLNGQQWFRRRLDAVEDEFRAKVKGIGETKR